MTKFDIAKMEKLAKEDALIEFQVKDLSKRNPDMKREDLLEVVYNSSVQGDNEFLGLFEIDKKEELVRDKTLKKYVLSNESYLYEKEEKEVDLGYEYFAMGNRNELELYEKELSLDHYYPVTTGYHKDLYFVTKEDDGNVLEEDSWLLVDWSQHGRDPIPKAEIVSTGEIEALLEGYISDEELESVLEQMTIIKKEAIAYVNESRKEKLDSFEIDKEKGESVRGDSVLSRLKQDDGFADEIEKLKQYGEVKLYYSEHDFKNDLKEMGLQSYMIDQGFEQTNLKEMASPTLDGFREFKWNMEDGKEIRIPYKTIYHESSDYTVIVMNKSEVNNQLEEIRDREKTTSKKIDQSIELE